MTSRTDDLSTSNLDSAERLERVLSLMDSTTPRMPLLVTTLSPALSALRVASSSLAFFRCGARIKSHMTTNNRAINPKLLIAPPTGSCTICCALAAGAVGSAAISDCWASKSIKAKNLIIIQIEPLSLWIWSRKARLSLRLGLTERQGGNCAAPANRWRLENEWSCHCLPPVRHKGSNKGCLGSSVGQSSWLL